MNYILKRIKNFRFKRMLDVLDRCHEKSGKNKLIMFFDMILCMVLYKSGYADYEFLEMYNLKHKDRKKLVTVGKNNHLVKKLNPKKYWVLVDDKVLFNERFKDFLGRDFIKINKDSYKDFESFVKNKKYIMAKPIADTWGNGVEKIKIDEKKLKNIFNKLIKNNQLLIEDIAVQHKDISKLYSKSINTIRVVSVRNKYGVTSIIGAIIRMGTGDNVVDNFHNGGIYAPIDIETGTICDKATNKKEEYLDKHPTTNVKLVGYKIPCWNKVMDTTIKAHNMIPELGYIGWDVYVSEDGKACFIEANQYPGHVLYKQMKQKDGTDIYPLFIEALNKKK